MRIDKIRIYDLRIPFCRDINHSLYKRSQTESIVVVVQDEMGNKGFGEGTPRYYVTGENLKTCSKSAEAISHKLLGQKFDSFDDAITLLTGIVESIQNLNHPAAQCAMETAILDLWSRYKNIPLWQLFPTDTVAKSMQYSGVIPYIKLENDLLQVIEVAKILDLRSIKVKIVDHESGLSQLKLIRENLGSHIDIRVDANAAFNTMDALRFIKKAKHIKLSAIEQPVQKQDLHGLKEVSRYSDIPVIADESMYTEKGPFYLIDNDICHGLNIRLSSCGGLRSALELFKQAYAKNMTIVIGAHVGETAILSFAGRHFASICSDHDYLEGSYSRYVLKDDLVPESISFGQKGLVSTPRSSGLGINIDETSIIGWSNLYASIGS